MERYPAYRSGPAGKESTAVPPNPAGIVELSDGELREGAGPAAAAVTTNLACAMHTFCGFRCPR